jgi:Flp pilus assembly pilin Flp
MKAMLTNLGRTIKKFNSDQKGAEMLEYILIFAAIALPLMGVIIYFWKDISKWANSVWLNTKSGNNNGTDPGT